MLELSKSVKILALKALKSPIQGAWQMGKIASSRTYFRYQSALSHCSEREAMPLPFQNVFILKDWKSWQNISVSKSWLRERETG